MFHLRHIGFDSSILHCFCRIDHIRVFQCSLMDVGDTYDVVICLAGAKSTFMGNSVKVGK